MAEPAAGIMSRAVTVSDNEELYARAAAEAQQLKALFSAEKLCKMLSRRYPQSVIQRLFPDQITLVHSGLIDRSAVVEPHGDRPVSVGASRPAERSNSRQPAAISDLLPNLPCTTSVSTTPFAAARMDAEDLGFQYVPLIQCTLPHSDPEGATTYTRQNGRLELTIATSTATVGLPYGVPARLLAIYTATEVKRWRAREIFLGNTITEFLRKLHVPVSSGRRGTIGMYLDQLRRLIHSVFTIQEDIADGEGRTGLGIRKVLFADQAQLWSDGNGLRGSSFHLSEPLFESMLERSAPLSMDAIRNLRRSPLDLDVYAWLVYRLYHLNRRLVIPWNELALQFGQAYTRERDFRTFFRQSLKRVLKEYPDARVEALKDGLCMLPSRRHIAPASSRK